LHLRRQIVAELEDMMEDTHKVDPERHASAVIAEHGARMAKLARIANTSAAVDGGPLFGPRWLDREIAEPDFLLGELLSTTSRVELIGPSGLGKTNLLVDLGLAVADGRDFSHWTGCGRPRRVLYVDREMSRRLARKRLIDPARRHGRMPAFSFLNREDYPDLAPLNTEAGQAGEGMKTPRFFDRRAQGS
jgi:hypothetical protein